MQTDFAIDWQHGAGCAAHYAWLSRHGDRLARWPAAPFESSHTDCFALGDDYWIWQPGVGGMRFSARATDIEVLSERGVDRDWFAYLVRRCWFPPLLQIRGRQVLHASAILDETTGGAIVFSGPSGAGKSTMAYGMARRRGHRQLCDDAVAFSAAGAAITLYPIDNDPRLRPATAAFFGARQGSTSPIEWPAHAVRLRRIYFLEPRDANAVGEPVVSITRLRATDAYQQLLTQAHALTLRLPALNHRLMLDYLAVAAAVPACRLTYRRSFAHIDDVFDAVEWTESTSGVHESLASSPQPSPAF